MRIIKPYGRSEIGEGKIRKILVINNNQKDILQLKEINNFALENPKILIAQWIAIIDKIFKKPNENEKISSLQRKARNDLGQACCQILKAKLPEKELEYLKKIWLWKLHPYGEKTTTKGEIRKGRWYRAFLGDVNDVNKVDYSELAKKIESHLFSSETTINGEQRSAHRDEKKEHGLIRARAESIEKSRLKQIEKIDDAKWSEVDEKEFISKGDLAKDIYEKIDKQKTDKPKKKIYPSFVGKIISTEYGKRFKQNGKVMSREEIRKTYPKQLTIFDEVRRYYKNILRNSKKKNILQILPKNSTELFTLLKNKSNNCTTNDLIRLGRVMHYENCKATGSAFGINDQSAIWNNDIYNSHYWTSNGQAEIKRTEAFVRIWRNVISLTNLTLKNWLDPEGKIDDDILDNKKTKEIIDALNATATEHLDILFGNQAKLFNQKIEIKDFAKVALSIARDCRNVTFHFKDRNSFVKKLKDTLENGATKQTPLKKIKQAVSDLFTQDFENSNKRIITEIEGAKIHHFSDDKQLEEYFKLMLNIDSSDIVLPKFNRLLLRLKNTKQLRNLPQPANSTDLENPALLAKYKGFKLLYEAGFRLWLGEQNHEILNKYIDQAVSLGSKEAQKINDKKNELITAKAQSLPKLREGEDLYNFLDNLTAASASEMRVQNAYASDGGNAREQAKWIDAFKCDVIGRAFIDYLKDKKLNWLFSLSKTSKELNVHANIKNLNSLISNTQEAPEPWLVNIYLMLHLVPVDEVSKLLHQLRKWRVLEEKGTVNFQEDEDVNNLKKILTLYIKMHDAKFEGKEQGLGLEPIKELFETPNDFDKIFSNENDPSQQLTNIRRGLREIMRFGNLDIIKHITKNNKITSREVIDFLSEEKSIAKAQKQRKALHENAIKNKNFSSDELEQYKNHLATIENHRHLSAQVKLLNHVKLHRLLMRVLARLIDYAGIWERDGYFITLALLKLDNKNESLKACLERGKINKNNPDEGFKQKLQKYYTLDKFHTRNDLAHFNILRKDKQINLSEQVNNVRKLMSYDRKFKNAISKSIIDIMHEEGFILKWKMEGHKLVVAKITSRTIKHFQKTSKLKNKNITEKFHGENYTKMVSALFA